MVRPTPVIRRQADPVIVQKLWASINFVRAQKQVANLDRVSRYAQREYQLEADVIERQVNFAVADQLISLYRAVAVKGTNLGTEQDGYRVQPAEESEVVIDMMFSSISLSWFEFKSTFLAFNNIICQAVCVVLYDLKERILLFILFYFVYIH